MQYSQCIAHGNTNVSDSKDYMCQCRAEASMKVACPMHDIVFTIAVSSLSDRMMACWRGSGAACLLCCPTITAKTGCLVCFVQDFHANQQTFDIRLQHYAHSTYLVFVLFCSNLVTASATPGDVVSTEQFSPAGSLGSAGEATPPASGKPCAYIRCVDMVLYTRDLLCVIQLLLICSCKVSDYMCQNAS